MMKRRDFVKAAGISIPAVAMPITVMANDESFRHDPKDYAQVGEEPEEFQEYEIDVPEDWVEEEIIWI